MKRDSQQEKGGVVLSDVPRMALVLVTEMAPIDVEHTKDN